MASSTSTGWSPELGGRGSRHPQALAVEIDGDMPLVITGEQHGGRFTRIYLLIDDDKLGGLSAHPAIT